MRHAEQATRIFGLSLLAALGLMALSTVAAQAENLTNGGVAGQYRVLGAAPLVNETYLENQEGTWKLLVAGRGLDIKCSSGHAKGAFQSETQVLATLMFQECLVLEHNTTNHITNCEVLDKTINAVVLVLPRLHGGKLYLLFEGDPASQPLATIVIHGAMCPLPLSNPLKGSFVAEIDPNEEVVLPLLLFSEAIQKLLGDKLQFGAFEGFIAASSLLELTGAHKGCKFGVV